jgi:hypothetical protein
MSDPLRTDAPAAADALAETERRVKIEELLLVGLDHYFKGEHEQAINVWTRVLFLDRSHARARAYIERARGALAERQRRSEELLHHGAAAFERGEVGEARELLQTAISQGAPREEALAVLDRLSLLGQPRRPAGNGVRGQRVAEIQRRRKNGTSWRFGLGVAVVLVVGSVIAALTFGRAAGLSLLRTADVPSPAVFKSPELNLDFPTRSEQALARARTLAASGHLHDALAALDGIKSTDVQKPEADRLRGDLQRQLVALAAFPRRPSPDGTASRQVP